MDDREAYRILQTLTSPIVAITSRAGEKLNGMVANSAIRASLVPGRQRVAVYVFRRHLTHELIVRTGRFVLHVLGRDCWEEIRALGFVSGRDRDKLEGLAYRLAPETRLPILERAFAWMECEVVNAMDAGPSTFFLGDIHRLGRGTSDTPMYSDHFRSNMPPEWRREYLANLSEAQTWAGAWERPFDDRTWRDMHGGGGSLPEG